MNPRAKILGRRDYQLKITLRGIRPPIWRRVQVPATIRLAGFHDVIQILFAWRDTHLHQFWIDGTSYGQPDDFHEEMSNENSLTLARFPAARFFESLLFRCHARVKAEQARN